MIVITILILITIAVLLLIIYNSNKGGVRETYSDVATNLLTKQANQNLSDSLREKTNKYCEINTNTNDKFQFKAENVMLDWYNVENKPNTCSVELGSDDIENVVENCSLTNNKLYDPTLVKNIYFDDAVQGTKRCIIEFKDNPSNDEMYNYLKKQKSYTNINECSEAVRQVSVLGEENRQLKEKERETAKRENIALRQAAEAEEKERQALAKASQLEENARRLQRQADAEETAARKAFEEAQRAEAERERVRNYWQNAKTQAEKAAYEAEMNRLANVSNANNLLANEKSANAKRLQNVQEAEKAAANAAAQTAALEAANAQKLQNQAQQAKQEQSIIQNQINQKTSEINSLNTQIQKELDRPVLIIPKGLNTNEKYTYMGCYNDDWDRALPLYMSGQATSVDSCFELAKKNDVKYFGLQWNSECWGGNSGYDKHGRKTEDKCKYECTGKGGQGKMLDRVNCGSGWANAVYRRN